MSMILVLTTISPRNIDAVRQNPPFVWRFIAPDDPDIHTQAARSSARTGFFDRIFGRRGPAKPAAAELTLEPGGVSCDLDKAWHAIHFLLTGSDWEGEFPLAFLLAGGVPLKDLDVGYGPPRILSPGQVAEVDDTIGAISADELCGRFDANAMAEADIYPEIWACDDRQECLD